MTELLVHHDSWAYKYNSRNCNTVVLQCLSLIQSPSLTSGCEVVVRTYQLSFQDCLTSNEFSGGSLPTSVSSSTASFPPFTCMQDRPYFEAQYNTSQKTMQKTLTFFLFFHTRDDSSEPVPSSSSELVDNRLPPQEGKKPSQESASTCGRPRPSQAPVKNVADFHRGSQA